MALHFGCTRVDFLAFFGLQSRPRYVYVCRAHISRSRAQPVITPSRTPSLLFFPRLFPHACCPFGLPPCAATPGAAASRTPKHRSYSVKFFDSNGILSFQNLVALTSNGAKERSGSFLWRLSAALFFLIVDLRTTWLTDGHAFCWGRIFFSGHFSVFRQVYFPRVLLLYPNETKRLMFCLNPPPACLDVCLTWQSCASAVLSSQDMIISRCFVAPAFPCKVELANMYK